MTRRFAHRMAVAIGEYIASFLMFQTCRSSLLMAAEAAIYAKTDLTATKKCKIGYILFQIKH